MTELPQPVIATPQWQSYELLDCGEGRKLERFGETLLIRAEPKAWWPADSAQPWRQAAAESGNAQADWRILDGSVARQWRMGYGALTFEARLTDGSKHLGVFPEQQPHWAWIEDKVAAMRGARVLNLFGYTGAASLVAAAAGAEVTHVDASKPALSWARRNQELSGMTDAPIRWLLDDAFKFVARELRRQRQYDMILLDPPSFGRGPRGEVWKVEQQIAELLQHLSQLLHPKRGQLVLTMYNIEASPLMLHSLVSSVFARGKITCGELVLPAGSGRFLPLSLFARLEY